ncbi:MAG: amidohydrolase family protein [Gemmatimonadota bacterium]
MLRPLAVCAALLFLPTLFGPAHAAAQADVAIVGATVIDPASGRVLPEHTVAIREGRITQLQPAAVRGGDPATDPLAAGATRVIDGRGRWLVPGLWDAHVHFRGGAALAEANRGLLPLYVANGITSVRDAGGDLTPELLDWRRRIAAGELAGPRLYTSGPKLDGPTGGWDGSIRITTPDQVPAALDSLQSLGADYVKIYDGSVGPDVFLAIVAEAERRGMPVTGHMPFSVRFADAVRAGLDATEHLYYAFKGAAANEDSVTAAVRAGELGFWDALAVLREGWSEARADSLWRTMAAAGSGVVPTLHIDHVLGHVADTDHTSDPQLAYIHPDIQATYEGRVRSAQRSSASMRAERIERHGNFVRMVGDMHAAGVPIYAGSDAGPFNSYVYPGWSLHEELAALVEAGLTPMEALRAATIRPAELLGVEERTGRIRQGADADLLLLDADPLTDIRNTRRIAFVTQANGRVWSASELAALLASVRR